MYDAAAWFDTCVMYILPHVPLAFFLPIVHDVRNLVDIAIHVFLAL